MAVGRAASLRLLSLTGETTGRERFPPVVQGTQLSRSLSWKLHCYQRGITRVNVCLGLDCTILTISCTGEVAPVFLSHSQRQMCTLHLVNKKYRFNSWTSPSQAGEFPEVIQIVSYLTQSLDPKRKPKSSFFSPLSSKPSTALSPRVVYIFQKQNYVCHPEKKPKKKWLSFSSCAPSPC